MCFAMGGIAITPTVVQAAVKTENITIKEANLSDGTGQAVFNLVLGWADPSDPRYTTAAMDIADQDAFANEAKLTLEGCYVGTLKELGFKGKNNWGSNAFRSYDGEALKRLYPIIDKPALDVEIKYKGKTYATYPSMHPDLDADTKAKIKEGKGKYPNCKLGTPPAPVLDKKPLEDAISTAEGLDKTGKTQASIDALNAAIAEAKETLNSATTQQEIQDAADKLAKVKLVDKAAPAEPLKVTMSIDGYTILDRTTKVTQDLLKISIQDTARGSYLNDDGKPKFEALGIKLKVNGKDYGFLKDFSSFKWGDYTVNADKWAEIIADQGGFDKIKTVEVVKDGTTPPAPVLDKKPLEDAISTAEGLDKTGKTQASIDALNAAIAEAKETLNSATTQQEIQDAADKLAKVKLVDKVVTPIDTTPVVDLKEFTDYADAFYYTDKGIVDHLDNNVYLTTKASIAGTLGNIKKALDGHNTLDILSIIGGVQAGVSIPLEDHKNIRVGGFVEYDNRGVGNVSAHHIGLGATVKTEDVKAFVRYRVATYKGKNNHNIDAYVNYAHNFVVLEKFHIEPSAGLYATYSSKVALDNGVELAGRFGVLGDASVKFAYVNEGLELYAKPELRFGYNNQMLRQTTVADNQLAIARNYMNYSLGLGVNKTLKNGVRLFGQIKFEGDEQSNGELGARVGLGYSWK